METILAMVRGGLARARRMASTLEYRVRKALKKRFVGEFCGGARART